VLRSRTPPERRRASLAARRGSHGAAGAICGGDRRRGRRARPGRGRTRAVQERCFLSFPRRAARRAPLLLAAAGR